MCEMPVILGRGGTDCAAAADNSATATRAGRSSLVFITSSSRFPEPDQDKSILRSVQSLRKFPPFRPERERMGHGWIFPQAIGELEPEPHRNLHQARRHGADRLAKGSAGDVAFHRCRPEELRMIEGVERFGAELEGAAFTQREFARDGSIEILHAGA